MLKNLKIILLISLITFLMCGCSSDDNFTDSEPVMCNTSNAAANSFYITIQQAYGTSKPEVKEGKDATPFTVYLTYRGKEGASYVLGDASDETDKYIRFRLLHANEYYFEEYVVSGGEEAEDYILATKAYMINTGTVLRDLSFLHFEPMEERLELKLWMIVPKEVMNSDESLYFIIDIEGQEFWFDITDYELDIKNWYVNK